MKIKECWIRLGFRVFLLTQVINFINKKTATRMMSPISLKCDAGTFTLSYYYYFFLVSGRSKLIRVEVGVIERQIDVLEHRNELFFVIHHTHQPSHDVYFITRNRIVAGVARSNNTEQMCSTFTLHDYYYYSKLFSWFSLPLLMCLWLVSIEQSFHII